MPHVLANDLRKSVLQAAFCGTLTERSSLDTPISITLKNAAKEAEALKIKHAKTSDNTDFPFDIPEEWAWCNLPDIGFSGLGKTLNGAKDKGEEKPYLCSINVYWAGVDLTTVKVARFSSSDIKKYRLKKGDLLTCEGGDVGRTIVWESDQEMYYQNALHRVRFFANNNQYYFRYLLMFYKLSGLLDNVSKGMTIKHFVQGALNNLPIPLPPIEEQSRIVARLDELMTKIDEYEKIESELTALHKKFPTDMKAAILQEAFSGNLTERSANDSSVDKYLLESQKKRLEYEKAYKEKKHNALWENGDFEAPFDIPCEWRWAYVGDVFRHNAGKALNAKNTAGTKRKYITTSNVYADHFELNNLKEMYYTDDEVDKYSVHKGDLLVLEGGDYGRTALWNLDESYCIQNHLHRLRPFYGGNIQYYFYLLTFYKEAGFIKGKGIGIQGLSANALHNIIIPIPPVEEQARIVAKLNQLLPLCDQLADMAS